MLMQPNDPQASCSYPFNPCQLSEEAHHAAVSDEVDAPGWARPPRHDLTARA
jgi:hypothetical protein